MELAFLRPKRETWKLSGGGGGVDFSSWKFDLSKIFKIIYLLVDKGLTEAESIKNSEYCWERTVTVSVFMLFLVSCNVWSCLSPNHIDDQILIISLKVAFDP